MFALCRFIRRHLDWLWEIFPRFNAILLVGMILICMFPFMFVLELFLWPLDIYLWFKGKQEDLIPPPSPRVVRPVVPEEEIVRLKTKPKAMWIGEEFELQTFEFLDDFFGEEGYVFHDVYLPIGENCTQCDLIVVHETGIYVVECKSLSGAIYGREKSEQWKQYLRGKEYPLYNPILQNHVHCGAVADTCNVAPDSVISIVLFGFTSDVRCDDLPHEGITYHLANPDNLVDKLEDLVNGECLFTPKDVLEIANIIRGYTNPPDSVRRAHLDYVQGLKERSSG